MYVYTYVCIHTYVYMYVCVYIDIYIFGCWAMPGGACSCSKFTHHSQKCMVHPAMPGVDPRLLLAKHTLHTTFH